MPYGVVIGSDGAGNYRLRADEKGRTVLLKGKNNEFRLGDRLLYELKYKGEKIDMGMAAQRVNEAPKAWKPGFGGR